MIIVFAEGVWLRESSSAVWLGDSGEFADAGSVGAGLPVLSSDAARLVVACRYQMTFAILT
jgi:hypothetical protein